MAYTQPLGFTQTILPNGMSRHYQSCGDLASHPKVVGIGEIGLDFYRQYSPHDVQKRVFQDQLELAAELNLPVVIHHRDAILDLLPILTAWVSELGRTGSILADRPGVLHSFSSDLESARQVASLGFYIGVTGPVTFRNAHALHEVVTEMPIESILVETDAPFLTPEPYRGKRNEPAHVRLVADKIAELKKISSEMAATITLNNAKILFRW